MTEYKEVDSQHKLAESCFTIARATEALIISAKTAFTTGDAEAKGNMATLAKALADQYHKVQKETKKKLFYFSHAYYSSFIS